jgi:hypothetical protein
MQRVPVTVVQTTKFEADLVRGAAVVHVKEDYRALETQQSPLALNYLEPESEQETERL